MESKKINQLATNVAPQTSDLTIIGDPITGVSKKITLLQIANLFATVGTVTSVAVTETGNALTITGSPITSAGTINIGFAGAASQYIRGDGALADFPTSTGGGSSVSYYLNSSVSQGTIGGNAYRQLSKTPVIGAGTDITISANGYIANYITDANDPALLEVPGGNFNCEFYFSVNSNNHNPYVYAELYKYDGTTFTLLGSSQTIPEYLTNGTTLSSYYFAMPVSTAALTITDRLAIRIYVNVDTRIVTLHTENSHLCQVVTTFSNGLTSLNNLTRQVQFLGTGTSGTDFNISSSTATHTFNLPVASATNTGKLSSTDWSVFNSKEPAITSGTTAQYYRGDKTFQTLNTTAVTEGSNLYYTDARSRAALSFAAGSGAYNSTTGVITIPTNNNQITNGAGYITSSALSDYVTLATTQTISGAKTFSNFSVFSSSIYANAEIRLVNAGTSSTTNLQNISSVGVVSFGANMLGFNTNKDLYISSDGKGYSVFSFNNSGTGYTYTFQNRSGTVALTDQLTSGTVTSVGLSSATSGVTIGSTPITSSGTITLAIATASGSQNGLLSSTDWTTFNGKQAALNGTGFVKISGTTISYDNSTYLTTSAASSTYLPLAGGTLTGALNINLGSATGLNVASDSVVFRSNTGVGSPRQVEISMGGGTSTYLDAKGYGANYITDFGIRTYNSSGTAFNVFYGTSAGDVGIGNTAPAAKLDVNGSFKATGTIIKNPSSDGSTALISIKDTSDTYEIGYLNFNQSTDMMTLMNKQAYSGSGIALGTNNTERVRITQGGNVGIGTSSPSERLSIVGTGANTQHLLLQSTISSANAYLISKSASKSYITGLSNDFSNSYIIYDETAADLRMSITSDGRFLVRTSTTLNPGGVSGISNMANPDNNGLWALAIQNNATTNSYGRGLAIRNSTDFNNGDNEFLFLIGNNTPRLYVQANGGVYNYSANNSNLSDVRTKKDIIPLESYWDKFKAIEIVKFKYKDQTHDDYNIGVIAQQVLKVAPEFVNEDGFGGKEYLPEDGIPLKSIYSEDLHNATIKVLQEAMAKIEKLEQKVKQLENK
jgi:hypothetical protein